MFRAALFDVDGVLINSSRAHVELWTKWGQLHGLDVPALLSGTAGEREIDTLRRVAPHLDEAAQLKLIEKIWSQHDETAEAYPGALDLLSSLPDDKWGVVTSGPRESVLNRFRLLGFPLPRVLVCAEDVQRGKPHADPYALGVRQLKRPAGECLVVEDAPIGVAAARAAGCYTIAVTTGSDQAELASADEVVSDLVAAGARVRELLRAGPNGEDNAR